MISTISQLFFWATPDLHAQRVAKLFCQHAAHEGITTRLCDTLGAVRTDIKDNPDATFCLIYTAPSQHLAKELAVGRSLDSAVGQWQAQTEALLSLYRQNRTQCLIFEATHLQRFSGAGLTRLGLASGTMQRNPELDIPVKPESPEALILARLAESHLQAQPDLTELTEELAASTVVLSNDVELETTLPTADVLAAFRAVQDDQQAQMRDAQIEHDHALAELRETLQQIKTQADTAQAEMQLKLAQHQGARDILQQQNAVLLSELRESTRQTVQQAQNINTLKDAQTRLTETHHKAQESHRRELDHQAGLHATQVHALEGEIARIMASRSVRLTAPLRRLMALLGRRPDV